MVRFRKALLARGLDTAPFDAVTGQLRAKAARVKAGTLVDATVIAPASEGEVFADSACRGPHVVTAVRARGGVPRIVATRAWYHEDADGAALPPAIDGPIRRVRGRVGEIFGA